MATIKVKDIKIYKNGAWRSLRGNKVYKNGAWRTFGTGSGVFKNGNWYLLDAQTTPPTPPPPMPTNEFFIGRVYTGNNTAPRFIIRSTYPVKTNVNLYFTVRASITGKTYDLGCLISAGQYQVTIEPPASLSFPGPVASGALFLKSYSFAPASDSQYKYTLNNKLESALN